MDKEYCKICKSEVHKIFSAKLLKKYNVSFFYCGRCGFLQSEDPYWLKEAYNEPISIFDTGILQRNIYFSNILTILLCVFFNRRGKFVDYAGGYGILVRLMRDIGFDFYWYDPYAENIFAKGFEWDMKKTEKLEAITAIEAFEHFVQPLVEIEKMLKLSKNIIFSTELLPEPLPKPGDWWYYALEEGQHISFYSRKTLEFIAKKYDLHYSNLGLIHLFTARKIPEFKLKLLKIAVKSDFMRFGLYKFFQKQLKSKTWEDYLKMIKK